MRPQRKKNRKGTGAGFMSDLHALAKEMAQRGVGRVFGIPGSGPSLTLLDALEKEGVPFYLTHFEGSAVLMAGAVGRLSGKAGAAIGIKGPGLANMVPGLSACLLEALPVVTISEAYLPGTPSSKSHKRMNHQGLLSAAAKGSRFLAKSGPGFSELAEWAESEVPGPVHLEIAGSPVEVEKEADRESNPGDKIGEADEALKMIRASSRPVLILGSMAMRLKDTTALDALSIPVFSVAAAKGTIDERLPQAAGVYTGVGLEKTPEHRIMAEADLVVSIGLRHNEVLNAVPFKCRSVNIDPLGSAFCGGFRFDAVLTDAEKVTKACFEALREKEWGLDLIEESTRKLRDSLLSGPFLPARVFETVEHHFNHQCRLVLDTGNFCTIGEHIWRVPAPVLYLASGQGRYMGIGLPLALGAAVYDRGAPTAVFLGDGGVGMFVAEIKLAAQYRLPLIILLLTDGYLSSIRGSSLKDHLTERPVTIHRPSWAKTIEGLGVRSEVVGSEAELEEILSSWSPGSGPLFLEIPFNANAYQNMVEGIR
ncbi:MAG: hypothetical protein CVU57_23800 [Deltaproteobacteria bacterium HGW-Deltaproteobacteria-15]|nr:MAG: hypothetical protein CVU57_23800 [Deltaproteobacteria bacterium HGW-Deltaproteobacteria-15]PKO02355.1 MAG: hypothetical protein CVU43_08335 [Chloroflexi bacterium HGW-Chloroflexi-5]